MTPDFPDSSPRALDALIAAPAHHTLLFENESVRVIETHIAPGDRTPVHTHGWPSVLYVLSASAFVRRDAQGQVLLDTRSMPQSGSPELVRWSPPLPAHSLENVGNVEIRIIGVELKRPIPAMG